MKKFQGFIFVLALIFPCIPLSTAKNDEYTTLNRLFTIEVDAPAWVEWSPNGSYLAITVYPFTMILESNTWVLKRLIFTGVSQTHWSPDSTKLAAVVGGFSRIYLNIWDVETGDMISNFFHHYEGLNGDLATYRMAWSPLSDQIATGGILGELLIWNLEEKAEVTVFKNGDFDGVAGEMDWSPDANKVAISWYGSILIWQLESAENLNILQGSLSVDWHPSENKLLTGRTGRIDVWDTETWEVILVIEHEALLSRWNYDGSLIATGDLQGVIQVWNGYTGEPISLVESLIPDNDDLITGLAWNPVRNWLATANYQGTINVWELNN